MKDPFDLDGDGKLNFAEQALKIEYMMGEHDEPNCTRSKSNPSYTPGPSYSIGEVRPKSICRKSFENFLLAGILAVLFIVVGLYMNKYRLKIGAVILTVGTVCAIIAAYNLLKSIVYLFLKK